MKTRCIKIIMEENEKVFCISKTYEIKILFMTAAGDLRENLWYHVSYY